MTDHSADKAWRVSHGDEGASPTPVGAPSRMSHDGGEVWPTAVPPSPMMDPSPAPLRQRLRFDGCAFQPCRRPKFDVESAEALLLPEQQALDDIEIIEID